MENLKSGIYSSKELLEIVGNYTAIHRAVDAGLLTKIGNGYYGTPEYTIAGHYHFVKEKFPDAIVSKDSALFHYGLMTRTGDSVAIDVTRDQPFRRDTMIVRAYRTTSKKMKFTTIEQFDGVALKTYIPERALFEVLMVEQSFGPLTNEVVRNFVKYFGLRQADILKECAEMFGERGADLYRFLFYTQDKDDIGG